MEKWDYKVIKLKFEFEGTPKNDGEDGEEEEVLKKLGEQGWELVSICEPGDYGTRDFGRKKAYLKKRKQE